MLVIKGRRGNDIFCIMLLVQIPVATTSLEYGMTVPSAVVTVLPQAVNSGECVEKNEKPKKANPRKESSVPSLG